jgi:hypothetical protein
MGFISQIKSKLGLRTHSEKVSNLTDALHEVCVPAIKSASKRAQDQIERHIPFWDPENSYFQRYIGYLYGLTDTAYQLAYETKKNLPESQQAIEIVVMTGALFHIDPPDKEEIFASVLEIQKTSPTTSGLISRLQLNAEFRAAAKVGHDDFLSYAGLNRDPDGLQVILN